PFPTRRSSDLGRGERRGGGAHHVRDHRLERGTPARRRGWPDEALSQGVTMEPIELYKRYVHERQMVWERRQIGLPGPWSDDPILNELKFCNNFRVLDRGWQYVLKMVQYAQTKGDVVLRAFLYRFTNMEVVWEVFLHQHGRWPIEEDLSNGILERFILSTGSKMNLFNPAYLLS